MIPSAVMWYSTKGGVGKSTHSANHAGLCAAKGWRVLLVDLDPQGNQSAILGYNRHRGWDGGENLRAALVSAANEKAEDRVPVHVMHDIRPGLDVIGGGPKSAVLFDALPALLPTIPKQFVSLLDLMLAPISADYDLILIDLPPTPSLLHRIAMTTAHYLILPVKTGVVDIDGMSPALGLYKSVQKDSNPYLEVLGIVLGLHDMKARSRLREAMSALADAVGDAYPVIEPVVRYSEAADGQMKDRGLLAHEYEQESPEALRRKFEFLRSRRRGKKDAGTAAPPQPFSESSVGLAEDYERLITNVNKLIAERQEVYAGRK